MLYLQNICHKLMFLLPDWSVPAWWTFANSNQFLLWLEATEAVLGFAVRPAYIFMKEDLGIVMEEKHAHMLPNNVPAPVVVNET